MNNLTAGKLFAVPLGDGGYVTGRIMLNIRRQCLTPGLIDRSSPLAGYAGLLLVDIYRDVYDQPTAQMSEPLLRGYFVRTDLFISGEWPLIGNALVDPHTVEFPELVAPFIGPGVNTYLMRGEVKLLLGPGIDGWNGIKIPMTIISSTLLPLSCRYYLGRFDQSDRLALPQARLEKLDLRFNERRGEVYTTLGIDPDQPYNTLAQAHGCDISRFYKER